MWTAPQLGSRFFKKGSEVTEIVPQKQAVSWQKPINGQFAGQLHRSYGIKAQLYNRSLPPKWA